MNHFLDYYSQDLFDEPTEHSVGTSDLSQDLMD